MQVSKLNRFIPGHVTFHLFWTKSKHRQDNSDENRYMAIKEIGVYSERLKSFLFFQNHKKELTKQQERVFSKPSHLPKLYCQFSGRTKQ